jgi:4-amino-4-deoxy-L-arabinose transferase-like glycosyltransferase
MTPGNELKYMSIVDNALKNGNYFVFYNQGVAYADKPPLYFWVIMLEKKIFGYYCEVGIGLFSVIPAIVGCYSMEKNHRK